MPVFTQGMAIAMVKFAVAAGNEEIGKSESVAGNVLPQTWGKSADYV